MKYIVHLKYPLWFWKDNQLKKIKQVIVPKEPHIITQGGERYVELPKPKYRIDEDPIQGLGYFVPITWYSEDATPAVDE